MHLYVTAKSLQTIRILYFLVLEKPTVFSSTTITEMICVGHDAVIFESVIEPADNIGIGMLALRDIVIDTP